MCTDLKVQLLRPGRDTRLYSIIEIILQGKSLIESNAKCRYLKKIYLQSDFAGVYLSEAPSPTRFLFAIL